MTVLWLAAASAASTASGARGHGGFTPGSTLPWSVPVLLIAPLVGLVMLLVGVRTRRGAAGLALLTGVVTLLDALLVGWARLGTGGVERVSYAWISASVASTGDSRFQQFEVDLTFRITHVVLAFVIGLLVIFLACITWQRLAGRQEPGPVRSQASALLLLLCAAGTLVSGDLAELFGFWAVAGIASYLLLGNRWGTEGGSRAAQVALALPYVGDLALLTAVAFLYSRFGVTDIDKLVPMLGHTPGVGLKSTGLAAGLVLVAVVARACVWPLTAWQTATVDAPPALAALVAGVWPLLAASLLYLALPLFGASGVQPVRIAAWTLGVAAVAGPLLSLVSLELRRTLILASSGAVALSLLSILYPGAAAAGLTGILAIAGARAAALLASGWVVPVMRAVDLRLMGEGRRRMPRVSEGLAGAALAMSLAAVAGSAWRQPSWTWAAPAAGLLLIALAAWRVYAAVALGQLPRRRAFEPSRVSDPAGPVVATIAVCGLLSLAAVVLAFIPAWTGFLIHGRPAPPGWTDLLRWLVPAIAGTAMALGAMAARRGAAMDATARASAVYRGIWAMAMALLVQARRPALTVIGAVELRALPGAEGGLARALMSAGALIGRGIPYLPAAAGAAIVLGVVLGLVNLGGPR